MSEDAAPSRTAHLDRRHEGDWIGYGALAHEMVTKADWPREDWLSFFEQLAVYCEADPEVGPLQHDPAQMVELADAYSRLLAIMAEVRKMPVVRRRRKSP